MFHADPQLKKRKTVPIGLAVGSVKWGVYATGFSAEGKRKTHAINGWDSLDTPMVNELGWERFPPKTGVISDGHDPHNR